MGPPKRFPYGLTANVYAIAPGVKIDALAGDSLIRVRPYSRLCARRTGAQHLHGRAPILIPCNGVGSLFDIGCVGRERFSRRPRPFCRGRSDEEFTMRTRTISAGFAVAGALAAASLGFGAGQASADHNEPWIPLPPPGHIGQIVNIPPGHIGQLIGVPPGQWGKWPH